MDDVVMEQGCHALVFQQFQWRCCCSQLSFIIGDDFELPNLESWTSIAVATDSSTTITYWKGFVTL